MKMLDFFKEKFLKGEKIYKRINIVNNIMEMKNVFLFVFVFLFLVGFVSAGNVIFQGGKIIAEEEINSSYFIGDGSLLTNLNLSEFDF